MLNLLDGLRDLKAPLASGLIILFGFWLIYSNEISTAKSGQSLAGNIHQLVDFLGGPASLGVAAFLAYVVGLVLSLHMFTMWGIGQTKSALFDREIPPFYMPNAVPLSPSEHIDVRPWFRVVRNYSSNIRLESFLTKTLQAAAVEKGWPMAAVLKVLRPSYFSKTTPNADRFASAPETAQVTDDQHFRDVITALSLMILSDIDLLAVQLQADKDKIFDKYEKNKTEGDFRAAIILPLLFVTVVLTVRLIMEGQIVLAILACIAGVIVAVRLALEALQRYTEANEAILNSLILGHIKSARLIPFEAQYRPPADINTDSPTT